MSRRTRLRTIAKAVARKAKVEEEIEADQRAIDEYERRKNAARMSHPTLDRSKTPAGQVTNLHRYDF